MELIVSFGRTFGALESLGTRPNQGKPLAVTPARFTAASESKAKRACAGFLTGPVSNRNQLVCPPVIVVLTPGAARFDFMGK